MNLRVVGCDIELSANVARVRVTRRKVAPMARRNEWKSLLAAAEKAGWARRPCKHGLYVFPPAEGMRPIVLGGTPSEHLSCMNTRAALRRAGLTGI